jgi:ubiquinone/menaquinone biosynthesis C-methylase UbiE
MSNVPRPEHPSTYVVQDRSNEEELLRLRVQEEMITVSMGGAIPDQPDARSFRRVLDVGCGPGGWLREVARTYPEITQLFGVDISGIMIGFARQQAEAEGLSGRLEYHVMDALRRLEFPQYYFDLVNHRLAASWLRTWDWPGLLREYQRVCQPGGIIRVSEANFIKDSSSPALNHLTELTVQALYQAGHYFAPEKDAVISQLKGLLQRAGLQNVQTRAALIDYHAGTPEWQGFFDDGKHMFRTIAPFLQRWIQLPDNYQEIYQQALLEMQQDDFVGTVEVVTAWGNSK